MTAQTFTVTTIGSLIEGLFGRLIPVSSLPLILTTIDASCYMAIKDDKLRGRRRKYSADARASYSSPVKPFDAMSYDEMHDWISAFWNWREMLTPHDFDTLNGERVVLSDVHQSFN